MKVIFKDPELEELYINVCIANGRYKKLSRNKKQVADIVSVGESQIAAYISGEECPTLQTAGSLCMALGIAPATMLGL